jgi:predicted enzyme related to lactoylglutathione lyase
VTSPLAPTTSGRLTYIDSPALEGQAGGVTMEVLFASVPVSDLPAALDWYGLLFGRPADIVPHHGEAMWCVAGNGWLYVLEDPGRAGMTIVTISVDDLDRLVRDLSERGITSGLIEAVGDEGRKSKVTDPDGNVITCIQVGNRTGTDAPTAGGRS